MKRAFVIACSLGAVVSFLSAGCSRESPNSSGGPSSGEKVADSASESEQISSSRIAADVGSRIAGDMKRADELWNEAYELPKNHPHREEMLTEVFLEMARIDPVKAAPYFRLNPDVEFATEIISRLKKEDVDYSKVDFANLYLPFSNIIAREDGKAGVEFALSTPLEIDPNRNIMETALNIWMTADPQSASEWVLAIENVRDRDIASRVVVEDLLGREEFDSARAWINYLSDSSEKKRLQVKLENLSKG